MSDPIKALTIRQPWAELILRRRKPYELRSWKTKNTGPLLIHAAAKIESGFATEFGFDPNKLTTGAFVGVVILSAVRPYTKADSKLLKKNRAGGSWSPNLFSWVLKKPRRIPRPIKAKGQLGLFPVPSAVAKQIERQGRTLGSNAREQRSKAREAWIIRRTAMQ